MGKKFDTINQARMERQLGQRIDRPARTAPPAPIRHGSFVILDDIGPEPTFITQRERKIRKARIKVEKRLAEIEARELRQEMAQAEGFGIF